jgi:ArsR family transcriptional regulator, arsenate/arsenite/antimonite-responsive transcriptional repressor
MRIRPENRHVAPRTTLDKSASLSTRGVRAISRVLADPRRFQILKRIAAQPCTACADLRAGFPITAATLSHHLKELETAGLIEITRRGKFADIVFQRSVWEAYLAQLHNVGN